MITAFYVDNGPNLAMMPEPTTTASKNAVPKASATTR
jgi:hypothetical protein